MKDNKMSPLSDTNKFLVRRADESDAQAILHIVSASMKSYSRISHIPDKALDASVETLADTKRIIGAYHVYVAEDGTGAIAGTFRLIFPNNEAYSTYVYDLPGALTEVPIVYFSRFAVASAMQNKGVGNLLLLSAEKEARMQGAKYLLLHTALSHSELVAFYQKRGFTLLCQNNLRGYERGLFGKEIG